MSVDASNGAMARGITYLGLAALAYIASMLAWLGWEFIQTHPHGSFRFEVFGLIFLVLFGPGTLSLAASIVTYAVNRSFPTFLQVAALLSAVWVAYMHAALEGISV